MLHSSDIQIRDPYVVPIADQRRYYLFGTTDRNCWGTGEGFKCYRGADLDNWEGPFDAFVPPAGFWADRNFWAPEIHRYGDSWFMLASFKAEGACRGTQVLKAGDIAGPYTPVTDGPVTPRGWECLDGTLHVEDGVPWLVFCHEWLQVRDGEMRAMPLTRDLRAAAGDPLLLFTASTASWTVPVRDESYVTDGPFVYRGNDGALLMLWSSMGRQGYAMGYAVSRSGTIAGPWEQVREPLYGKDGGHGMLFTAFDGQLLMSLHRPNDTPDERPLFVPVRYAAGRLSVDN